MVINKQSDWDKTFLLMAELIAERHSKDPSRKVGAVLARESYPLSFGYNGFVRGYPDKAEYLNDRETKLSLIIHAEHNAILNAVRNHINIQDATLYTTLHPCFECAKVIAQSGIKRVVTYDDNYSDDSSWIKSFEASKDLFDKTFVTLMFYKRNS